MRYVYLSLKKSYVYCPVIVQHNGLQKTIKFNPTTMFKSEILIFIMVKIINNLLYQTMTLLK